MDLIWLDLSWRKLDRTLDKSWHFLGSAEFGTENEKEGYESSLQCPYPSPTVPKLPTSNSGWTRIVVSVLCPDRWNPNAPAPQPDWLHQIQVLIPLFRFSHLYNYFSILQANAHPLPWSMPMSLQGQVQRTLILNWYFFSLYLSFSYGHYINFPWPSLPTQW